MKNIRPTWNMEQINEVKENDFVFARFATLNKNCTIDEYKKECSQKQKFEFETMPGKYVVADKWRDELCKVEKVISVSPVEYDEISNDLLAVNEKFEKIGGTEYIGKNKILLKSEDFVEIQNNEVLLAEFRKNSATCAVLVKCKDKAFIVNTEGYGYARYVGLFPAS